MCRWWLLFLCAIGGVTIILTKDLHHIKTVSYRLPNNTRPETYDITIETRIDQANFTFIGCVKINIIIINETNVITIHKRQLDILSVTISVKNNINNNNNDDNSNFNNNSTNNSDNTTILNSIITIDSWSYDNITEFLTIKSPVNLIPKNKYVLTIKYSGTLRGNDLYGFYSSSYVNADGDVRYLATTQFQPTDARHGFPCYDEPAFKANFTIRIIHAATYSAISNMPQISSILNDDNETVTTVFQESPLMSTYLIAFVISDFLNISNYDNVNELPQRIFASSNSINKTLYAFDIGSKVLDNLQDYLQINFSLPKIDHVSIPDFRTGAMENWGLITYNSRAVLTDNTSSYETKLITIPYMAHELAHQWFGNLVSPKWWTYLWLNEGLAIYLSYYLTHIIYPEWEILNYMYPYNLQQVFQIDASSNTHPMTHYVESQLEIYRLFDKITYDKSSCVLRMFSHAFTEDSFLKGLQYYLSENAYSVITEQDLFDAMERAVIEDQTLAEEFNVSKIMSSWTQQSGFPVLYVNRNYENNSIIISQERFFTHPTSTISPTTFWIPINFATAQNPDFSITTADYWLPQNERFRLIQETDACPLSTDDWIIFNKQQTGYYRVQYDRKNWNLIAQELNDGDYNRIHVISRSQIIDDAFTFVFTKQLSWDIPLNIIRYLQYEMEYTPWVTVTDHLFPLQRYFAGLDNYDLYRKFICNITENVLNYVGIEDNEDEPILMKYMRTKVINWACTHGSETCLQMANTRLKELINNNRKIHPNLRDVIFCAGLRKADENDMNFFLNHMHINGDDRGYIMLALGCISNETLLNDLLQLTLNESTIVVLRTRIYNSIFDMSLIGYQMAVQFLIDNIDKITTIFYSVTEIELTILDIGKNAIRDDCIQQAHKLFELLGGSNGPYKSHIKIANEFIMENIKWSITNRQIIDEWLLNNVV